MKEYININEPDEGDTLVQEDSNDSPSLMLVLSGTVELSQINPETNEPSRIHKVINYSHGHFCFVKAHIMY